MKINPPWAIFIRKKLEKQYVEKEPGKKSSGLESINKQLVNELNLVHSAIEIYKADLQLIKENEARLNELNDTKDKFISIIAHDLKGPFSSIIGFSNLLAEKVRMQDYKEIEDYARFIQTSSWRAMDLLNNLLEWTRTQTGRIEFHPRNVMMGKIISEVTELLSDAARQKSINIHTNVDENAIVFADKAMINTILRNLISNAIKFTNQEGKIWITGFSTETESQIAVIDNGIGISQKNIYKLFRIEESLSTKGTMGEEGTGLGLFLCSDFAKRHGGEICVESNVEKGSKFTLKLPSGKLKNSFS